jgi:hypothetical protein
MPKDFYTLLILPQASTAPPKDLPLGALVKGVSSFMMVLLLALMYFSYDYIHIRREHRELARLKQQTLEQRQQLQG